MLERDGVAPERAREAAGAALEASPALVRSSWVRRADCGTRHRVVRRCRPRARSGSAVPAARRSNGPNAAERRDLMFAMLEIVRLVARDWAARHPRRRGRPAAGRGCRPPLAGVPERSPARRRARAHGGRLPPSNSRRVNSPWFGRSSSSTIYGWRSPPTGLAATSTRRRTLLLLRARRSQGRLPSIVASRMFRNAFDASSAGQFASSGSTGWEDQVESVERDRGRPRVRTC